MKVDRLIASLIVLVLMTIVITAWISGHSNILFFNAWLSLCLAVIALVDYVREDSLWNMGKLVLLVILLITTFTAGFNIVG